MDAATFAARIVDHVDDGWEHVADITRPGTASKVAAVRAGDATTTILDARSAARLAAELDDPAAVAGDTRSTVLAAAGDSTAAKRRRSPTAALFDGTGEEVHAAITERTSTTPAMIEAYVAAPRAIRDITADHLATIAEPAALAAIFAERCARYDAPNAVAWYRNLFDTLSTRVGLRLHTNSVRKDAERQIQRLGTAAATALGSWLATYGTNSDKITSSHLVGKAPAHVTEAAGEALAALAAEAGVTFAGPRRLGAAALTCAETPGVVRSAAASGVGWSELRPYAVAGADTDHKTLERILAVIRDALSDRPRTNALITEILDTEFGSGYDGIRTSDFSCQAQVKAIAELTDDATALRFCAITGDFSTRSWHSSAGYTSLAGLLVDITPARLAEIRADEALIDHHVRDTITTALAAGTELHPRIWRHTLAAVHIRDLAALAEDNTTVAAELARELTTRIDATAGDDQARRAALWQATCALAGTLAAPASDAIEIADTTLG